MKHRLYDGGTILVVVAIVVAAYVAAGSLKTGPERCAFYKAAKAEYVAKGMPGGEAEQKVMGALYRTVKWGCLQFHGIEI